MPLAFKRSFLALLAILICCLSLVSCHKRQTVITGFYYWKTNFTLSPDESALLKNSNAQRLYLRFFDVEQGWQENFPLIPVGRLEVTDSIPKDVEVVPVVFITNHAISVLDSAQIVKLADKIRRKVQRMCDVNHITSPKEYQLDCDWNAETRKPYFQLVALFKEQVQPARVSVTIRLHQYKYMAKTGVPPADRGILMFYNMSNVRSPESDNYILDIAEAQKYLSPKVDYPLPLDIGMPVYSQGVMFKENKFQNLVESEEVEMAITNKWLKPLSGNWYQCTADSGAYYNYLDTAMRIRYERVTPERLLIAANMLKNVAARDSCNIVFFHLDSFQCKNFTANDFKKVAASF